MCELVPFDYQSDLFYDAVRVYTRVWGRNVEDSMMFFRKYTRMPHFHGVVAQVRDHVVGMAFGTASRKGQWWHDKVAAYVGRTHPALQQAWVLTELAVLPSYQDRGIGSRLLAYITQAHPLPHLLLSTQVANVGARRFYERHGWYYLHRGFAFQDGHEPYVIMARTRPTADDPPTQQTE